MKKFNRRERAESCACTAIAPASAVQSRSIARPSQTLPPPIAHHASCNTIGAILLRLCIAFYLSAIIEISTWVRINRNLDLLGALRLNFKQGHIKSLFDSRSLFPLPPVGITRGRTYGLYGGHILRP